MADLEKLEDETGEGTAGIYRDFHLPGRSLYNLKKNQST